MPLEPQEIVTVTMATLNNRHNNVLMDSTLREASADAIFLQNTKAKKKKRQYKR